MIALNRSLRWALLGLLSWTLFAGLAGTDSAEAAVLFFIDDQAGFDAASGGLMFAGIEDWESSSLAAGMIVGFPDVLQPGIANGPFPNGTDPATGLTVQSNTLGGNPINLAPRGARGLATASVGYFGTPTDQVSTGFCQQVSGVCGAGDSFDMRFGLPSTSAVSFVPLVFDVSGSGNAGTAAIRVFDTNNVLIGTSPNVSVSGYTNPTTLVGVVATAGDDIGRINIFATSVNDSFAGADDIRVFTSDCVNDGDCDGILDADDNCPGLRTSNVDDADRNGIGDECECGDQNGDGTVDVMDLLAINAAIFTPGLATPLCDTNDDDLCDVQDILGANAKVFGAPAYCASYPTPVP
jgi:hypothetical protein